MSRRLLVLLFLVTAGTVLAHAGRIEISEPTCDGGTSVDTLVEGFAVTPTVTGGGSFTFCNNTGVNWTNVVVGILTTAPISQIQCPSSTGPLDTNPNHLAFSTCVLFPSDTLANVVYAYLFGVSTPGPPIPGFNPYLGVPNGAQFTINLDCEGIEGCIPWPAGTRMVGSANVGPNDPLPNPVPEPASLALLSSGLAAGIIRRKIRV